MWLFQLSYNSNTNLSEQKETSPRVNNYDQQKIKQVPQKSNQTLSEHFIKCLLLNKKKKSLPFWQQQVTDWHCETQNNAV